VEAESEEVQLAEDRWVAERSAEALSVEVEWVEGLWAEDW
jgi:hypothetical protein